MNALSSMRTRDRLDFADFEPGDDAVEDVLLDVGQAAAAAIDGDASARDVR